MRQARFDFQGLALREWVTIGAVVVAIAAFIVAWPSRYAVCTTRIVETQSALAALNGDMKRLAGADQGLKCAIYRKRVAVLKEAAPVAIACGSPQATKGSARPQLDGELSFYRGLITEQCDQVA